MNFSSLRFLMMVMFFSYCWAVAFSQWEEYTVGNQPWGMCDDGSYIWVVNNNSQSISKIRKFDGAVLGPYSTTGKYGTGCAYDGKHIWVAMVGDTSNSYAGGGLDKIDRESGSIITHFEYGTEWKGLLFDGKDLLLLDYNSKQVVKFNLQTETFHPLKSLSTPPGHSMFDGRYLWITTGDEGRSLYRLNLESLEIIDVPYGDINTGIAYDGTYIYAGNQSYDRDTLAVVSDDIGWAQIFNGRHLWYRKSFTEINELSLSPVRSRLIGSIPIPDTFVRGYPEAAIFDGEYVWLSDFNHGKVRKSKAPSNHVSKAKVTVTIEKTATSTSHTLYLKCFSLFPPLTNFSGSLSVDRAPDICILSGDSIQLSSNSMEGSFRWDVSIPNIPKERFLSLRIQSDQYVKDVLIPIDPLRDDNMMHWVFY